MAANAAEFAQAVAKLHNIAHQLIDVPSGTSDRLMDDASSMVAAETDRVAAAAPQDQPGPV